MQHDHVVREFIGPLALPSGDARVICLDAVDEREAIAAQDDSRLGPQSPPENLAYVMCTSGSTGKPKGIAVTPVLAGVPAPVTVECDAVPAPAEPTATDNCTVAGIEFSDAVTAGTVASVPVERVNLDSTTTTTPAVPDPDLVPFVEQGRELTFEEAMGSGEVSAEHLDVIANVGVLLAAAAGYVLASRWPDILVGSLIASLFLHSAVDVLRRSMRAWRASAKPVVTIEIPTGQR